MECPRCQSPVEKSWFACPQCGEKLGTEPPDAASPRQTLSGEKTEALDSRQVLANRYRVVRELGRGGMGIVYLAEDLVLNGRQVAVKLLPPLLAKSRSSIEALRREAITAMEISHPNVVTLRGFEETPEAAFLVMDYVDGETLEDRLRHGPLPEAAALEILGPVAEALDHVHQRGIVHRDLKPSNVIVAADGTPKITDFGVARHAKESLTRLTGLQTSGTLLYMSPEQLMGDKLDARADVYSFAVTLYECLTGDPPFTSGDIATQILRKTPTDPPGASPFVAAALRKGLAKTKEERFPSAGKFLAACREPEEEPPLAIPVRPEPVAAKPPPARSEPPARKATPPPARKPAPPPPPRKPSPPPREPARAPAAPAAPRSRTAVRRMLSLLLMVLALGGLAVLNPRLVERLGDAGAGGGTGGSESGLAHLLPADDTFFALEVPDLEAALLGLEAWQDRLRGRGGGSTPALDEVIGEAIEEMAYYTFGGENVRSRADLRRHGVLPGGAAAILLRGEDDRPTEVTAFRPVDPGRFLEDLAGRLRREAEDRQAGAVIEDTWGSGANAVRRLLVFPESGGKGEPSGPEYEVALVEIDGWVLFAREYDWGGAGSDDAPPAGLLAVLDTAAGRRTSMAKRSGSPPVAVAGGIARLHASVPNFLRLALDDFDIPAELISGGISLLAAEVAAGTDGLGFSARADGDGTVASLLRAPAEKGGRFVPTEGLVAAQFLAVDPARLFPVIESFLPDRDAREEYEDGLREFRQDIGYDLRREVEAAAAGELFVGFHGLLVASGRQTEVPRLCGGIRAADPDRALRAMSRFVAVALDEPRSVRIGGREMWRVEGERRYGEFLEWGLVDGWLLWATDEGLIESAIRASEGSSPSLATDDEWRYAELRDDPAGTLADPGRLARLLDDPRQADERELYRLLDAIGPVAVALRTDGDDLTLSVSAGEVRIAGAPPYRTIGSIAMVVLFVLAAFNLFRPGRRR